MKTSPLILSIILLTTALPALAGNVLFVNNNGSDDTIATALAVDGHNVTASNLDPASPGANTFFQGAGLNNYCAVVWSPAYARSVADLSGATSTLASWVSNGGHLLITSPDGVASSGTNPNGQLDLDGLAGGAGGRDNGYNFSTVANISDSLTTGLFDIRNQQPSVPSDTDSLCGPLGSGTVGLVTTPNSGCPSEPGYVWTLRTLGSGQVAFITSGNFNGGYTDPDWSSTAIPGDGVYNAGLRNFVHAACTVSKTAPIPATTFPVSTMLSALLLVVGAGFLWRRRTGGMSDRT
jgi:hypothetical protein